MLQDEAKKELAKLAEVRRRREEAAGPKTAPVVEAVPDAEVREKEKKTKSKKDKAAGEKLRAAGGYLPHANTTFPIFQLATRKRSWKLWIPEKSRK